jgi:tetratricopeptide (TPR) repeat protein
MKRFISISALIFIFSSCLIAQSTSTEWYRKGNEYKNAKKIKEAIDAYKNAVSLDPTYSAALHELGWCYNEQEMFAEALDVLLKEEKNNPDNKSTNAVEIGYAYKSLNKYDEAISYYNKAIEANPKTSLAYKDRGFCLIKKKKYESALNDYNKYEELVIKVTDAGFYFDKGWCENELLKYSDAVESLLKCVEVDNTYSKAYNELGYAYYKLKLNAESETNYRLAIMLDKESNYLPLIGLADLYYDNLKKYDSAIVYYVKGTQIKKNKTAFYRIGWIYNDKEKFTEALNPLTEAVSMDDNYEEARIELGYAYYKLNRNDEALAQFLPIMSRNPKNELSRYYAGFCYYLKNDQFNLRKMIDELTGLNTVNALKYAATLKGYIK